MESVHASESFEYNYENKNYKITILEKSKENIEIYCNTEKGEDFYCVFKDSNFNDIYNYFISVLKSKKIKIKDKSNDINHEIELLFPFPRQFKSLNGNQIIKTNTVNKKDDFEYNVIKEEKDTYLIIIGKNNDNFQFKLSKNDLESINFNYETKDIIEDIKNKDVKLIFDENKNAILQIMTGQKIALKPLDNIMKLNIMSYFLDEKPIFNQKPGITKMINEINNENNNKKQTRINKLIKEMNKKQKEILDTYPKLLNNIKIMKENAELMIFPKEKRTLTDKESGVEFDSYIIGKKKDFELINNKLKQVYDDKKVKYELIYRASRDRDLSKIFKEKCRNVRGTLIIVKTDSIENKRIFGGFTTKVWDDSDRNYDDDKAFCFSVNENKIYDLRKYCSAIGCDKGSGPRFCWMFEINNKFMMEGGKVYREEVSHYSGQKRDYELNGGEEFFIVYELEVFKIIPE